MRQPSRASKRKRPPEKVPSAVSLEVISVVLRGNRGRTKRRIVEKMDLKPQDSSPTFPTNNAPPTPDSQPDPSTPTNNVYKPSERAYRASKGPSKPANVSEDPSGPEEDASEELADDESETTSRSVSVSFFHI